LLVTDGYFVPKGIAVGVSTIGLYRNPEVWAAPLEFNPDLFLPENSRTLSICVYSLVGRIKELDR